MKVIAALDSFKGSVTSAEANEAVLANLPRQWNKVNIPIADGGEGTAAAIYAALGGKWQSVKTVDCLGNPTSGEYLLTTYQGKRMAVIEVATFIGWTSVSPTDKTTRQASSFGVGLPVKDALKHNVDQIYMALGGSATSDGGLGFLQAMGARLSRFTSGNPLLSTQKIDLSQLQKIPQLMALADVTNPYYGENGFAPVFGPQKGASAETVALLDKKAQQLMAPIAASFLSVAGAGAAGGLGLAALLMGGKICNGFATIQTLVGLEKQLMDANLVFTGEGKIDRQTQEGKVPFGVAQLAQKHQLPVIALTGKREENLGRLADFMTAILSIQVGPTSVKEAMERETTLGHLAVTAQNVAQVFLAGIESKSK